MSIKKNSKKQQEKRQKKVTQIYMNDIFTKFTEATSASQALMA